MDEDINYISNKTGFKNATIKRHILKLAITTPYSYRDITIKAINTANVYDKCRFEIQKFWKMVESELSNNINWIQYSQISASEYSLNPDTLLHRYPYTESLYSKLNVSVNNHFRKLEEEK